MEHLNFSINDEIIDVEWCFKNGHNPPKGRKYRISIDGEKYIVNKECMSGTELLHLAGKTSINKYQIRQKIKGGTTVTVGYEQIVCFVNGGIEKFKTIPLDQTEGQAPSGGFSLLEEDVEYLNSLNLPWETLKLPNGFWLFIKNYPIVSGYNVSEATIGIMIQPLYPTTQLDMVYFFPALTRLDGQFINNLTEIQINGLCFQQWSRHRTAENPWRIGIDNLSTHIPLIEVWLSQEFIKRPKNEISA